ncbi:proline racemase [Streptomyces sp. V2I9]|nr:proline racemase [Streptomyces sp. V2I9]
MSAVLPVDGLAPGPRVRLRDGTALIAAGREIHDALNAARAAEHPDGDRLPGVHGTVYTEEADLPAPTAWRHPAVAPPRRHGPRGRPARPLPVRLGRRRTGGSPRRRREPRTGDEPLHASVVGSVFSARIERTATVAGSV